MKTRMLLVTRICGTITTRWKVGIPHGITSWMKRCNGMVAKSIGGGAAAWRYSTSGFIVVSTDDGEPHAFQRDSTASDSECSVPRISSWVAAADSASNDISVTDNNTASGDDDGKECTDCSQTDDPLTQ